MTKSLGKSVDVNGEEPGGAETLIDILSGDPFRATPKTRLVQKVLRQLIETYGFDRNDIRTRYRLTAAGRRQTVDIVIFRRGKEALDEHVERVIVCQHQKPREKLRSPQEASADLRKLHDKLELLPACHLGMWTNGHEEFFVRVEQTRVRDPRLSTWGHGQRPASGPKTSCAKVARLRLLRTRTTSRRRSRRCHQYLTGNLSLIADAFKPLGALTTGKDIRRDSADRTAARVGPRRRTIRSWRPS